MHRVKNSDYFGKLAQDREKRKRKNLETKKEEERNPKKLFKFWPAQVYYRRIYKYNIIPFTIPRKKKEKKKEAFSFFCESRT